MGTELQRRRRHRSGAPYRPGTRLGKQAHGHRKRTGEIGTGGKRREKCSTIRRRVGRTPRTTTQRGRIWEDQSEIPTTKAIKTEGNTDEMRGTEAKHEGCGKTRIKSSQPGRQYKKHGYRKPQSGYDTGNSKTTSTGLREGYARSEKCIKPYCPKNGAGLAQLLDQPCPSFEVHCPSFGTGLIEYHKKMIRYDYESFSSKTLHPTPTPKPITNNHDK